jgi:hypothetical protein
VNNRCETLKDGPPNQIKKKSETKKPAQPTNWGTCKMTTPAIWLVYTLMFGYPVPTLSSPQFSNQTSCLIYLGTLDQQVVQAFQLVCSRDHV